jgi:hypothetical protein
MRDVLLRPEEVSIRPAADAVKAPDELAALGLDCAPRRPKSLAIRAKVDYERAFTRRTKHYNQADASAKCAKNSGHYRVPAVSQKFLPKPPTMRAATKPLWRPLSLGAARLVSQKRASLPDVVILSCTAPLARWASNICAKHFFHMSGDFHIVFSSCHS